MSIALQPLSHIPYSLIGQVQPLYRQLVLAHPVLCPDSQLTAA